MANDMTTPAPGQTDLAAEAYSLRDFWLCLARAFAPPGGAEYMAAFREDLPADLETIAEEIGLHLGPEIAAFRAAASAIPDATELQKLYAALFLTPPTPVMPNTGVYLDGGLMGESTRDLDAAYARHGFQRHTHFRDLSDTPAVQADFLALLYDKAGQQAAALEGIAARAFMTEAEDVIARFPARWATPLLRDLEAVSARHGMNPAYAHLARILWLAVEGAMQAPQLQVIRDGAAQLPAGSSRGIGELTAVDLAEIACRLERDGLAWDHVAALDGWDDAVFAARRAQGEAG